MPVFTVTGDIDPFLHVSMRRGETSYYVEKAVVGGANPVAPNPGM